MKNIIVAYTYILIMMLCGMAVAQQSRPTDIALPGGSQAEAVGQPAMEATPLTNKDIVSLVKSGVDDLAIISLISQSPAGFDVSLSALGRLHDTGVSKVVINEIRRRTAGEPSIKPEREQILTNNSVVALSQAGLSDANIIFAISKSDVDFNLQGEDMVQLKKAGVTNPVIEAMAARYPSVIEVENIPAKLEDASGKILRPAQENPKASKNRLTFYNAGLATPQTTETLTGKKIGSNGFAGGFQWLWGINDKISIGADWDYSLFGSNTFSYSGAQYVFKTSAINFSGLAKYSDTLSDSPIRPMLFGGIGLNYFMARADATPLADYVWSDTGTRENRVLVADSSIGLSIILGAGLEGNFSENWVWNLAGRYTHMGVDVKGWDKTSVSFLQYNFGVGVKY